MTNQAIAELIQVSNDLALEIVKSAIFKLLIQIDRSSKLDNASVLKNVSYWICINLRAISKKNRNNKNLINRLEDLMRKLSSPPY